MNGIHPALLKHRKEYYAPGTRVMLLHMNDPFSRLNRGARGTVLCVDDLGTIHVQWDNGSQLGVTFEEDACKKIEGDE